MRVVLVGNQNSGKSTLFNLLTKKHQKIANYPGATVDFMEGYTKDKSIHFTDLPGVFSLTPYSPEQEITLNYLLNQDYDLILNVIDVTQLERSLYLTTQLSDLDKPVVVALNMSDILKQNGENIHLETLEKRFGMSFIKISATKNDGIFDLLCLISSKDYLKHKHPLYPQEIETEITKIIPSLNTDNKRYYALKLLENHESFNDVIAESHANIASFTTDLYEYLAHHRYNFIEGLLKRAFVKLTKYDKRTAKIDKILLNKYLAIPIFLLIMFFIYTFSVGFIGSRSVDFMETSIDNLSNFLRTWLSGLNASSWSISLLVDGVINGVGTMAAFIPQLIVLFIFINLLEATGYMTRIAFFLNKLFRRFGLSGRALIPFILGSGCSVPAIMSSRTIANKKERDMTIILTPMIPCSAKLPIITLFGSFFFKQYAGLITFLLYLTSILVILLMAIIMKYLFKVKTTTGYLSEMPTYKLPKPKYLFRDVINQVWDFIKNATTIILLASLVIWVLLSFNFKFQYGVPIEKSILAYLGNILAYLFYPLFGELSWASSVSILQGLVAKEQVVSSMKVIASVSNSSSILTASVFTFFTTASALSFMIFNLFSAPCIVSIAAMKGELGSTKKTFYAVLFQTGFAYLFASLIFWILHWGGF